MIRKVYFSGNSQDTLDAWTGGICYRWLWEITIGKLKINIWWKM